MVLRRCRLFRQEIIVLYFGCRDSRTPLYAKLPALLSLVYLISPIDLIPDFIPLAGFLDDLVIVPLLFHLSFNMLPEQVRTSSQIRAKRHAPQVRVAMIMLLVLFALLLAGIFFGCWNLLTHPGSILPYSSS